MSVRLSDEGTVMLEGHCPVEDAERLLQHLLGNTEARVDWTNCDHAHAAIIQILLVAGSKMQGPPRGAFLRTFIAPLFSLPQL